MVIRTSQSMVRTSQSIVRTSQSMVTTSQSMVTTSHWSYIKRLQLTSCKYLNYATRVVRCMHGYVQHISLHGYIIRVSHW